MVLFNKEEFEELRREALKSKYGNIPDSVDVKLVLQTEIQDLLEELIIDKYTIDLIRGAIQEKRGKEGVVLRLCSDYPDFDTDKYYRWDFQEYDWRSPILCIPFEGKPWPGKLSDKIERTAFNDLAEQIARSTLYESRMIKERTTFSITYPNGELRHILPTREEVPVSLTNVRGSLKYMIQRGIGDPEDYFTLYR